MSARSASNSMLTNEVFRARAFRLALAFCFAISAATAASFGFIYMQISTADVQRVAAVLVDEAAKSDGDSDERLRRALELRLTRDIRRLDYVALFDPSGAKIFGDVPAMPPIAVDGAAHVVRQQLLPDFERLRASHFRRPSPSGRRGRALRAGFARGLRPAGDRAAGLGHRPSTDGSRNYGDRRSVCASRLATLRRDSRRDRPHHERRASLAPADRK